MRQCPIFLVVRRRSMRFPVQGQFTKDGRHTGCGSYRYVTGMLVWSKVRDLTGRSKDVFFPRWFHDTHTRSRSYGLCCWGWMVPVLVRLVCVVYLVGQVARHGEPITTIRWSWVSSRLDRRVKAFRGCICRSSVTRRPSGTSPQ
jgi:hypothetical protein